MKKIMTIAAAALVVLAGCKQNAKSSEEVLDEFSAAYTQLMDDYRADAQRVDEDESLTDEQKEARWEELQNATIAKMTATGKEYIKNYPGDTLVVPTVIGHIYSYLDDAELDEVLSGVAPALKENKLIASIAENLNYRKATAVGNKFVDFTVDHVAGVDKNGEPVYEKKSLSDFVGKGKVMLVDFWSPWCPPCKEEIPNIKAVWEKYHGADFDVLSVAVWEESRKMNWRNTIDTAAFYGMKWNQLNNGHKEPATLYGISGIPHMILFDKDGTILKRGDDLRGAATAKAVAEVLGR